MIKEYYKNPQSKQLDDKLLNHIKQLNGDKVQIFVALFAAIGSNEVLGTMDSLCKIAQLQAIIGNSKNNTLKSDHQDFLSSEGCMQGWFVSRLENLL